MRTVAIVMLAVAVGAVLHEPAAGDDKLDPLGQWGQWRGPLGTGVAPRGRPPIEWSETKNVRWKTAIPGKGHASPIVWGDLIFLTTAVEYGEELAPHGDHAPGAHDNLPASRRQKFITLAVDRRDGTIIWQRTLRDERPHEGTHSTGTWASNSPVTDGERLYAYFGSRGLYCLDMDGSVLWERDFGDMHTRHGHGEGSSPALHGDTLVVNWDHQGDSFVAALDARSGEERWRVARDEITSWSTPLIVVHGNKPQVVISATKRVRAYDLNSGAVVWECGGLSRNVVASPVAGDGFVYVGNSYDGQALLAIRLAAAKGDITNTDAIAWTLDRHTPYVPSPLLYGKRLYFLKHYQGFLTCLDAKTGTKHYGPERLGGVTQIFASPVGAAGRIYIAGRGGSTAVIKDGPDFELLARNHMDDSFSASPAIVGSELFLRGERHLYCIAKRGEN